MTEIRNFRIALRDDIAESKSRVALYAILDCNLRLMENWRDLNQELYFRQFDYETIMVMAAAVVIAGESIDFDSLSERMSHLEEQIPINLLRRCTVSAIAEATALNRETVRRKVKLLEGLDILVRNSSGSIRFFPGVLNRPEIRRALHAQLRLLVRLTNKLSALGIVEQAQDSYGVISPAN